MNNFGTKERTNLMIMRILMFPINLVIVLVTFIIASVMMRIITSLIFISVVGYLLYTTFLVS